jgi:UDP-N-acetylglucosamine:LPS N-acetylglucosamine transferase
MFEKRAKVVLMVYGKGGHTAQMHRFINNAPDELKNKKLVALSDVTAKSNDFIEQFYCVEARDKYSYLKNAFVFMVYFFWSLVQMTRILFKYKITGMISTGPGVAVVPAAICRLCGIKVIYFESWSRIFTPSLAGKIMYRIANVFFIQHTSLQKHYPQGIFSGRL